MRFSTACEKLQRAIPSLRLAGLRLPRHVRSELILDLTCTWNLTEQACWEKQLILLWKWKPSRNRSEWAGSQNLEQSQVLPDSSDSCLHGASLNAAGNSRRSMIRLLLACRTFGGAARHCGGGWKKGEIHSPHATSMPCHYPASLQLPKSGFDRHNHEPGDSGLNSSTISNSGPSSARKSISSWRAAALKRSHSSASHGPGSGG